MRFSYHTLLTGLLSATLVLAGHTDPDEERALQARGKKVLIPDSCFKSNGSFLSYFAFNYPWGDSHNGAALMSPKQVSLVHNSLQLRSDYVGGGKLSYHSGTVHAKQHFTVAANGGLDFQASFVAPVARGTWPAFWLTAVNGWPPEIDLAEWKGTGKISFNTFSTKSRVTAQDFAYATPATAWHKVLVELRPEKDNTTVKVDFYMNHKLMATHHGENMVGKPFWMILDYQMLGSSGSPGPTTTTNFLVQHLSVTSYNL